MATAKKTAKKTPAKKTTRAVATATLPSGYTAISAFAESWDYESKPLLEGTVSGKLREVTIGKGRNARTARIMSIADDDGVLHEVWESASLRSFFDAASDGQRVAIAYGGERDVGQPQPMKVFTAGFADVETRPARRRGR